MSLYIYFVRTFSKCVILLRCLVSEFRQLLLLQFWAVCNHTIASFRDFNIIFTRHFSLYHRTCRYSFGDFDVTASILVF